ncbi:MAG: zinc-ribbon domain-containing protein [Thermoguttaceae bacterium]
MATKCPKGHWYEPEAPGGRCPQCATQTQSETSISDDDVLAIINLPIEGGETSHTEHQEGPAKSDSGSAILRRKKICPECSHEASYSFVYCPRCGAPLKLVSTKLGNS